MDDVDGLFIARLTAGLSGSHPTVSSFCYMYYIHIISYRHQPRAVASRPRFHFCTSNPSQFPHLPIARLTESSSDFSSRSLG